MPILFGRVAIAALMSGSLALLPLAAQACTSFLLTAQDGGKVYGRTLEFGLPLHSKLLVIPRNFAMKGTAPDGTGGGGLAWTGKYGVAGANGLGLPIIIDGMNEQGLAGGLLFFPGYAKFQDVAPSEAGNSIASFEMLTYILTSFATVAEVRANLPKIKVSNAPQATFQGLVPLHVTLHDAGGSSLVIEYVDGQLNMYDNPTTILTNAPALPWHLANLGLYGNLSGKEPAARKVGDLNIAAPSTGAGLHGMPGDSLSPSRFVRAFNFVQNMPVIPTTAQAVTAARHILNNFDIPPGSVLTVAGGAGGGIAGFETTEWSGIADLKNRTYAIWTYANATARKLDFAKLDLDAKAVKFIPLDQPAADIDLSK
ncbi:linear amide C-N hydrolase [Ancylobacter sp. G4_0304]|uniref:linear amide C-N hydrolase n=1 Tax=Ancylobacter sp. G4_0304 TaxID=3114289 RepID=UPI0039C6F7F0